MSSAQDEKVVATQARVGLENPRAAAPGRRSGEKARGVRLFWA